MSSLGFIGDVSFAWNPQNLFKSDTDKTAYLQSDAGENVLSKTDEYNSMKINLQRDLKRQTEEGRMVALIGAIIGVALLVFGLSTMGSAGISAFLSGIFFAVVGGVILAIAMDVFKLSENLEKIALHPNRFCKIVGNDVKMDNKQYIQAIREGLLFIGDEVEKGLINKFA